MNIELIPQSMKEQCRWICWKEGKVPVNPHTGRNASVTDPLTWADFGTAIDRWCDDNDILGIGFVLGGGFAGIDLDNHPNKETGEYPMSDSEFSIWADEVIRSVDSYAEWSPSGKGVHIFFRGTLPQGRRRNDRIHDIEMYDGGRFFTVTGNCIYGDELEERSDEAAEIWKKYTDDSESKAVYGDANYIPSGATTLDDSKVIDVASKAKNGTDFQALYSGSSGKYESHSQADLALCNALAFYTQCDRSQMDRIFRSSGLMREKWDERHGEKTYGEMTIDRAINDCHVTYDPSKVKTYPGLKMHSTDVVPVDEKTGTIMNVDMETEKPIPHIDNEGKKPWDKYDYSDYDNACFFNDTYGGVFKYNNDDKKFMFWTGKAWKEDSLQTVNQYMNDFGARLKTQHFENLKKANEYEASGQPDLAVQLRARDEAFVKNCLNRVLNTSGRNAIVTMYQSVSGVPAKWDMFDKEEYYLNTDSGVVDIRDGTIHPFDKKYMQSRSTNCEISFEEPERWNRFMQEIFYRGESEAEKEETRQLVEFMQMVLGICCLGTRREQFIFIMYGGGSNGKSTMMDQVSFCLGDYYDVMDSSVLMSKQSPVAAQNAMAEEVGVRCLTISESSAGSRLDMSLVKRITGDAKISAQKKYGDVFTFAPKFNPIMMTNNLPIISETDYGTWRRIIPIPFNRRFSKEEKDVDLPIDLCAETSRILGWMVKGYQKYMAKGGNLETMIPDVIARERQGYQQDMNNISQFIESKCDTGESCQIKYDILYRNYVRWVTEMGGYKMPQQQFDKYLIESRGFRRVDGINGKVWKGITISGEMDRSGYTYDDYR